MSRATIRTLFLDIGGVILSNGWDHHARHRAADHFGLDRDQLDERHHLTFDTYEVGKLGLDEYLRRVVFHQPREFSLEDFRDFMFAQSRPIPDMLELVGALRRAHGLRVVAVSNEGRELTLHRVRTFDLRRLIDVFVSSCFVHLRKPDEDIYRLALDCSQSSPEEVAYLDDRPMFVDVARQLGIHGIHHTGTAATRSALAELGLALPSPSQNTPGAPHE